MAKNKLFQKAVIDTLLLSDQQQISRDIPILNERNLIIISRYYVYTELMNVSIERTFEELKSQFFFKEKTIKKIVYSRKAELQKMCKAQHPLEWFKAQQAWSHLDWDYNPLRPSKS